MYDEKKCKMHRLPSSGYEVSYTLIIGLKLRILIYFQGQRLKFLSRKNVVTQHVGLSHRVNSSSIRRNTKTVSTERDCWVSPSSLTCTNGMLSVSEYCCSGANRRKYLSKCVNNTRTGHLSQMSVKS